MAFDGLFTTAMVKELQVLKEGRISKIHQPNKQEIVFLIRSRRTKSPILSVNPSVLFTDSIN